MLALASAGWSRSEALTPAALERRLERRLELDGKWKSGLTLDDLKDLYHHGEPSNDLSKVGLTIHSFDGSENGQHPWKPCTSDDWCKPFKKWWSASVINAKNGNAVSHSGLLLSPKPKHTKVLCSATNASAMGADCEGAHPPKFLEQMLKASLDASDAASSVPNELRIDSRQFMSQLPDSVAGVVYLDDAETPEELEAARSNAARVYLGFLREYGLKETDIPLIRVSRDLSLLIDESKSARGFLRRSSYERFRTRHQSLDMPEDLPPDLSGADDAPSAGEAADDASGPHLVPDRLRARKDDCKVPQTSVRELTQLFRHGHPSNELAEVGLMVHGFDGMEDWAEAWKPCSDSWCDKTKKEYVIDGKKVKVNKGQHWWSGSVISRKNYNTYSKAGIILTPKWTEVMCSFYSDFGTFDRGCSIAGLNQKTGAIQPYEPDKLKNMLKVSYNRTTAENAMYNEILIDAKVYERHLPGSISAVVYFHDEVALDLSSNDQARMEATKAYIGILDAYDLTPADLPLLKIVRPDPLSTTGTPLIVDKSEEARDYYSKQNLNIYRQHRPHVPILSSGSEEDPRLRRALKSRRRQP